MQSFQSDPQMAHCSLARLEESLHVVVLYDGLAAVDEPEDGLEVGGLHVHPHPEAVVLVEVVGEEREDKLVDAVGAGVAPDLEVGVHPRLQKIEAKATD